jgi:hypothetical protein
MGPFSMQPDGGGYAVPGQDQQPEGPPDVSFTDQATSPRWTSADDMRYARKAASLNQLRDDLDAGVLYPHDAAPLFNRLSTDLAGMDQQKQQFDTLQQQSATQAALHAQAMQQGIVSTNRQHDADSFLNTIRDYYNPVTGQSAAFYQTEPGKWSQVQMDAAAGGAGAEAPTAEGGAAPGTPEGAGEGSGEGGPQPQPFTQTIFNGPNRTDTTWQPGQTQGVSTGSWMGIPGAQPPAQAGPGESFGLSPERVQEIRNLASAQSMHMKAGPQRDALYSHLVQRFTSAAIMQQSAEKRATAVATAKQRQAEDSEWRDLRTAAHSAIEKDHQAAQKAGDPSPFGTPQQRLQAADDLAHEQWAARHPESQRAKDWLKAQEGAGPKSSATNAAGEIKVPGSINVLRVAESAGMTKKDALDAFNAKLKEVKNDAGNADRVPYPEGKAQGMDVAGGPWKDLPEPVQRREAIRRMARDLEDMTGRKLLPDQPDPPQAPPPPKVDPLPAGAATLADVRAEIERRRQARDLEARRGETRQAAVRQPGGGGMSIWRLFGR